MKRWMGWTILGVVVTVTGALAQAVPGAAEETLPAAPATVTAPAADLMVQVQALHEQIRAKQWELNGLRVQQNVAPDRIQALEQELARLRDRLHQLNVQMRSQGLMGRAGGAGFGMGGGRRWQSGPGGGRGANGFGAGKGLCFQAAGGQWAGRGWQAGPGRGLRQGPRNGTGPRAGTAFCPWYQAQ